MPKYFVSKENKPEVEKILENYCYKPKWDGENLVVSESLNDRITDILGNLLVEQKNTCPKCGGEMEIQDVLISRTTDPEFDDLFEKMWACNKCDWVEPIINSEEEE